MAAGNSLVFDLVARDRISGALEKVKEKFGAVTTGIASVTGAGLGAGIAASLDLSDAQTKLKAQLGLGAQEAAKASTAAANVFKAGWGEDIGSVSDAVKDVYQQIGDTSKAQGGLQGVTTKVVALSETFDQDLGGTTAAVGQLLKTGLAKNADEALDILTKGFQSGADKAGDLLDTFNEYGTQFRKLGIDGKTATGLISQGLKNGARDADLVADSIKEFSIRAVDGSKTTAAGFKAIGLNASDLAKRIGKGGKSASDALQLTLDKLRAIHDPVKRSQAAVQLFGTQAEDLGAALYSLDPAHAVDALGKVSGAAGKLAKSVGDTPKQQLESFKRQVTTDLGEIGAKFLGAIGPIKGALGPLALTLGGIAGTVLLVRGAVSAWTTAQQIWTGVQKIATAVQWAWNAALDANPITLIIIAIVALVAAIVVLWKKNAAFRDFIKAAWKKISGAITGVFNWVKQHWPLLLAILTGPIGLAVLAIVKNWDKIKAGGIRLYDWIKALPGRIARATRGMFNGIRDAFRSAINWIIGKWNGLSFTIPSIHLPGLGSVGGATFHVPSIPYLAKGGHITGAGTVMVGERGPELLTLPGGATVTPLSRAGGAVTVRLVVDGADQDLKRLIRRMVRVDGRGSVQTAFG